MSGVTPTTAREVLDIYFIENRARLLDLASFLDRIDRYDAAEAARHDFRYKALLRAIELLREPGPERTKALQLLFSDLSSEPLESGAGLKATGAWEEALP